jgi:hypothetical protein
MLAKGSRYGNIPPFTAVTGRPAFAGLRPRPVPETPGVVEHVITTGERLDLIARHYYDDDRSWWRIVDANPWLLHERRSDGTTVFAAHLHLSGLEGRVILIPKGRA